MKVIICESYEEISQNAAQIIKEQLQSKPDSVLGFATGSTPVGTYRHLIEMYNNGEIDFSKVTSFNLDEYYPISHDNPQSYHYFMRDNLFDYINLNPSKIHIPDGETDSPDEECENYEKAITEAGGIDLQILGIGRNGHIGFNEPDAKLNTKTHVTSLTDDTIDANSRFFSDDEVIPDKALTMGMATILSSRKIIILANGHTKHNAVSELLSDSITTGNPSTMLKLHPNVTLICDRAAYADMRIGIDIGGMSAKLGVVDDSNKIIDRIHIPLTKDSNAMKIANDLASACEEFIKKYPISTIGIGSPGIIKDEHVTAVNLPFDKFPIGKVIEEHLNLPVKVANDANCAALGEDIAGAGANVKNMILITLGTGIGAGIIIDDKIYSGRCSAGEAGHICINVDGLQCSCGSYGCWERYASASALIEQTYAAVKANPDSILAKLSEKEVTGKTAFDAAEQGCPVAKKVLDRYTDYLAAGIISLSNLLDPELILISGGISNAGEKLLTPLRAKLPENVPIRIAELKNDAGIIGAAAL